MVIEYELTVEDIVISSSYDARRSFIVRLRELLLAFFVSLLIFPLMLFFYYFFNVGVLTRQSPIIFLLFVFCPTIFIFFVPAFFGHSVFCL